MSCHVRSIRPGTTCLRFEPLEQRTLLAAFNLANYEENIDLNLTGTTLTDLSGIAYNDQNDRLYMINNDGQGDIVVFERDGTFVAEIDMDNFDDPEAIVHMGGSRFAVIEEEDLGTFGNPEFHISIFSVGDPEDDIDKSQLQQDLPNEGVIVLTHANLNDGGGNQGPEGLAYDAANGYFYFAKEDNDIRIFRVPDEGGTVEEVSVPDVTGPIEDELGDISDIYFTDDVGGAGGRLHILSDEGDPGLPSPLSRAIMADVAASGVSASVVQEGGTTIDVELPVDSFEGITFSPDSFEMFFVEDGGNRRFQQWRNFTVIDPDAPDLAAGSDSGILSTDNITNDDTPTFTGTVPEDATVWVYVDGVQTGSPHSLTNGNTDYSITLPSLADGTYDITIKVGESSTTPEANRSAHSDALEVKIDTTAPQVSNVTISGSNSTHDDYAIPVGSGAQQLKTVPVGGADTVILAFNEAIDLVEEDLVLKGRNPSETVTTYGYDVFDDDADGATGPWTATWTFDETFASYSDPARQMHLTLTSGASAVQDIAGNTLDGEWDNPSNPSGDDIDDTTSDTFPSGNGSAGGDFTFSYTILMGDADQTNKIDIGDLNAVNNNFGTGTTWAEGDFNGDGDVDIDDKNLITNFFGTEVVDAWDGSESFGGGGGGDSFTSSDSDAPPAPIGFEALMKALRDEFFNNIAVGKPSQYEGLFGWDLLGDEDWWDDLLGEGWQV